ncbi:hypothetical protein NLJ89_g7576 [Agrocybe chaxingu]|uniref:DUF6593 domain-containing protein n=1 Tax=Agrocybe chaxingu TaxID=84603 RepID=A0A9W8JWX5_9AGAR|nr:hypothetical protein NLJ89_g7576 [Agrocybe chaxingu]
MDLFFVPNSLENTLLVSANGVAHYQIQTTSFRNGSQITLIQRPDFIESSPEESVIAEIEWHHKNTPTVIRSPMLGGVGQCVGSRGVGVKASKYLYKRHRFSPVRYFVGDDAKEYRWKLVRNTGCILTRLDTNRDIACSMTTACVEGLFAGERKQILRIQPCALDIDVVVLTFLVMERKRRARDGGGLEEVERDEDPQGDGGGSGDGDGDVDVDVNDENGADSGMLGEI